MDFMPGIDPQAMLLWAVFTPVVGAFLLPILGRLSAPLRNIAALLLVLVPLAISAILVPQVLAGNTVTAFLPLPLGFNFVLRRGRAGRLHGHRLVARSASIIVLYSFATSATTSNRNEYYLMVVLFLGAMMGLVFSANLILPLSSSGRSRPSRAGG